MKIDERDTQYEAVVTKTEITFTVTSTLAASARVSSRAVRAADDRTKTQISVCENMNKIMSRYKTTRCHKNCNKSHNRHL